MSRALGLFLLLSALPGQSLAQSISSIAVTYSPPSPQVGEPYTATATVTATGPATPAGTVQVLLSGNPESCTTGPLTGSGVTATATCTLVSSTAGSKPLLAFYLPGNYPTTTPAVAPVTIQPAATSLALKVLPDPSSRNRVFVQALVQPDVGTPTGTYTFTSGPNSCSPAAGENWCSLLPDQSTTTPVVSVSYSGDANFGPASAGTPITVTDFPWIRRLLSAPLPNQATDPYSNVNAVTGSDGGSWSDDGRYFVFSTAESLVPVDSNGVDDVYLWDERNRTTTLLSYGPNTLTAANAESLNPRISGDGRFVAFQSVASNLVSGDNNTFSDIFRQDLQTGARVRITPDNANNGAFGADISTDGRYVSFVSTASNLLVTGDTNNLPDAFRADLQTSPLTLIRVSVSGVGAGVEGTNGQSSPRGVTEAAINGNGQIVAFMTDFTNADFSAGNSTLSQSRPFIRNLTPPSNTVYVSTAPANLPNFDLAMSKGSVPTVTWTTLQALAPADNNSAFDVYARTPPTGPLQLVSSTAGGIVGIDASSDGRISGDGTTVVFASRASNLAGGIDYSATDVYAKTLASGAIRRVNVRDGTATSQSTQQFQFANDPSADFDASQISFSSSAIDLTSVNGALGGRQIHLRKPAALRTQVIARRPIGGQANASSFDAALSANAANVAMATAASNLVAGVTDANGLSDIYLRPAAGPGTTAWLISRTPGGQAGNGVSEKPTLSSTATPRVAFQSDATDLVAGDSNLATDILIASPTGPVSRISVSTGGVQADNFSYAPSISADGERVVFTSFASNLVAGATGEQVYLREVSAGVTTLVSRATGATGVIAGASARAPRISADGRVAVFVSEATNLVSGVTLSATSNIYLRELQAPFTTRIVSANAAGTIGANSLSFEAAVDGTGSRVAFVTAANDLLSGDNNNRDDIYVRDMATGAMTRASLDPLGGEFTAPVRGVSISADGRHVGFVVDFAAVYAGDPQAYVRDLQTGVTVRVDLTASLIPANGRAEALAMAGNGAYVALLTEATNLFPGDLNAQSDVVLLRNPLAPLPATLQITSNGPTVTGQPIQATVRLRGEFGLEPRPRGNITVTGNSGETCTITDIAALNTSISEGSCTLSGTLNPGPRTLSASYTPTGTLPDRYAAASGTVAHTVNQGSVSLSTGFGSGTPVVGQIVTFSASVPAAAPAVGTPTGTVTVSVGGGLSGTCTITLPASNCTIGFTNAGSGSVTFSYSGDANFLPQVNSSPITVGRANTTLSGSFLPSAPLVGANVVFSAALTVVSPGAGTPTGDIIVSAGGGLSGTCTITLPASNCTIAFGSAGTGTVSFGYVGNANFNPSSSTPIPITVTPLSVPTITSIVTVSPSPVLVGDVYTVTVGITSANGTPSTGTVTISAVGFPDSCTIVLPANACSIPQAQTALPGVRNLIATYSGTTGFDPSVSTGFPQTVRLTSTFMPAPTLSPTPVVVGQAFTATGTLQNTASGSPLVPSGVLTARVLPLGNLVSCTLTPQSAGIATYSCPGLISPIAAAKVVEIRYSGSMDQVFPANTVTINQTVGRAPTQTRILAATPDPSNPGQPVTVSIEVLRAPPATALPDLPTGTVEVGDGVDRCLITLPASSCALNLNTSGLRTLTARYGGDANHEASTGTEPHTVTGGTADLSITKRNNRSLLPGGGDISWLVEIRNAGPSGTAALVRDPVPTGLSNFRWTCAASSGSQCSSAIGSGPLLETVTLPAGGIVSYLLTATVQAAPERVVEQRASVEAPTGVADPNLANNEALDADSIGVFGAGFEADDGQPVGQPVEPR